MAKKASKAARYSRLLKTLFDIIDHGGNLDEVRWGNCSDLIIRDPGRILDLKDRFEKIQKER